MADISVLPHLSLFVQLTASLASLAVLGAVGTQYASAYMTAPSEITMFLDTVDFSIQENESYDRDVGKVQRLEDKLRLGKLLREIKKCGDDLREALSELVVDEGGAKLHTSTRLFWAWKRTRLEQKMKRLDMLRMRFLVLYMGMVAAKTGPERAPPRDPEKQVQPVYTIPKRPQLPHSLTESIANMARNQPLRRTSTQPTPSTSTSASGTSGVPSTPSTPNTPRTPFSPGQANQGASGWMGVISELQNSPLMQKRRASVEKRTWSPRTGGGSSSRSTL